MQFFEEHKSLWSDITGYWHKPNPCEIDGRLTTLVGLWRALASAERHRASAEAGPLLSSLLVAFAWRQAIVGVRLHDQASLETALLALGMDGWRFDERENRLIIPLIYDGCRRIGVAPADLFERCAQVLDPMIEAELKQWLKQPEAKKDISSMGFVARSGNHGFEFHRTW